MIIDGSIVFVGSLNWSETAMKYNREASVIIYSKEIASSFEKIFDMDFGN
jgi:phosphatidylserine/phosphatidylglycerophosphate/cardiolipin synthase-like enzyme